jgi:hypothetical protein
LPLLDQPVTEGVRVFAGPGVYGSRVSTGVRVELLPEPIAECLAEIRAKVGGDPPSLVAQHDRLGPHPLRVESRRGFAARE